MQVTKRERRQFKKQQELKKQQKNQRRQRTKKIGKKILVVFVIAAFVGPAFLLVLPSIRSSNNPSEIISRNGIHWHSELLIYINNEKQDISSNIGAGAVHLPIHTHESDGVIHMEFPGIVKENDLRLSKFFKVWRKNFNKECIFNKCNGPDGRLKMLVNGRESTDFENYIMKDGDKIKIVFEAAAQGRENVPAVNFDPREITIIGNEYSFEPSILNVRAGEKLKIIFQNNGKVIHNLIFEGLGIGTKTINSGQTSSIEFIVPDSGTYAFFCSVPGHRPAGMEGELKVE